MYTRLINQLLITNNGNTTPFTHFYKIRSSFVNSSSAGSCWQDRSLKKEKRLCKMMFSGKEGGKEKNIFDYRIVDIDILKHFLSMI